MIFSGIALYYGDNYIIARFSSYRNNWNKLVVNGYKSVSVHEHVASVSEH